MLWITCWGVFVIAERRMFAKTIIDSDAFIDMPLSTQALYFHLSMRADDDGFINNPRKIQRMVGAADDDLKVLITKKFIIPFESGIVVIKHWKIHNYIQRDRYKETMYLEEKAMLDVKDNKGYKLRDTECIQDVYNTDTQVRLGKESIELGKESIVKPTKKKYGEYQNVFFTDEQYEKLLNEFPNDYNERIDKLDCYIQSTGKKYKDCLATIRNWARKEKEEQTKRVVTNSTTKANNNPFFEMLREDGKL